MKLQILSDLHIEFEPEKWQEFMESCRTDADVLVLAGDIATPNRQPHSEWRCLQEVLTWASNNYPQVFYITGNHEYYGSTMNAVHQFVKSAVKSLKNVKWLRAGWPVEHNGQRFVGDTMWFEDQPGNALFERHLNDFHLIIGGAKAIYDQAEYFTLLPPTIGKGSIVVTHHLPAHESVSGRYRGNELNRFFVRDVSGIILEKKPALWIHGHTHDSADYMLGSTRVICNPRGYPPHTVNPKFNPRLTIEV